MGQCELIAPNITVYELGPGKRLRMLWFQAAAGQLELIMHSHHRPNASISLGSHPPH
jgi:hypothetical protein